MPLSKFLIKLNEKVTKKGRFGTKTELLTFSNVSHKMPLKYLLF
jgi:hypothetical protein